MAMVGDHTASPNLCRDTVPHTHTGSCGTPQTYRPGHRGALGATCMPAQCPCSTLPVGSQFQPGTNIHVLLGLKSLIPTDLSIYAIGAPAPMSQGSSLTARP